jgi:hypothetical protein
VLARAAIGVLAGVVVAVLGLALFTGETFTADEVECGVAAPDLATGREVADGSAALRDECARTAREEVAAGLGAVILGSTVAARSLLAPRLHRALATEAARMAKRRTWGAWRPTVTTARIGLGVTAVAAPLAIARAPIASVVLVAGGSAAAWVALALLATGPRIAAGTDGLAVRSRWFFTTTIPWHDVELIVADPQGIELWTDDLPHQTDVLAAGWSGRRRSVAEAAARSIATEVARATGRPEAAVPELLGLELPPDAIVPGHPEWDEAWREVRAEDRRALVIDAIVMALVLAAILGLGRVVG